jgi:phosphorylcholine metabolism protein LicD
LKIKSEIDIASKCDREIFIKFYKKKYFKPQKKNNSRKRDFFFKEIIKILNKNFKKKFFLAAGTLLGYARNDDFIDWDDNIDLCFYYNYNSLIHIKKLQKIFINKNFIARIFAKKNFFSLTIYKYGYNLDFYSAYRYNGFIYTNWLKFPERYAVQLKKINFKGVKVYIPSDYNNYLNYVYGDWKKIKKKNYYRPRSFIISFSGIKNIKYSIAFFKNLFIEKLFKKNG